MHLIPTFLLSFIKQNKQSIHKLLNAPFVKKAKSYHCSVDNSAVTSHLT